MRFVIRRGTAAALCVAMMVLAAHEAAATTVSLRKNASTDSVESGAEFGYNLVWSCPGSISPKDDCIDMRIVEPLPAELQATALPDAGGKLEKVCVQAPGDPVPDYATCTQPDISADAPTAPGATLHFIFVRRIIAGDAGSLRLETRFPVGSTADGTSATNEATISASCNRNADPNCVDPRPVTATSRPVTATAKDEVTLDKRILSDSAVGFDMVYRIRVCPGSGTGYVNPENVVVRDLLPAEATFVSASPAPTAQTGQELEWAVPSPLADCANIDVTVRYDTDRNNPGDSRTNTAEADYTPLPGSPALPRIDRVTHVLAEPGPRLVMRKFASDTVVNPGQEMSFTLQARNTGNVPLGVRIEDPIPSMCRVLRFVRGADSTGCSVTLSNGGTRDCSGAGTVISAAAVGANNSSVFISAIRVDYGDADNPGVPAGENRDVNIRCAVSNPGWDGADLPLPATVRNTVTGTGSAGSLTPVVASANRDVELRDPLANPTIQPAADKTRIGGGTVSPGSEVTFQLAMTNSAEYSSAPEQVAIAGPIFADLLLPGMTFVSSAPVGTAPASCTTAPAIDTTDDYNGTGRTLVVWDWSGTDCELARGDVVTYDLVARVGDTTPAGNQTNHVTFIGADNPPNVTRGTEQCPASGGDVSAIAGDSARVCDAGSTDFRIRRVTNVASSKEVTGTLEPPGTWKRNVDEPDNVARSIREGNVRWRLRVSNSANVPLDSIELIDIVPAAPESNPPGTGGNSGVGTGEILGTTWTPTFVREIDLSATPPGTKVYYTQTPNPCRDNIATIPGCNPMTALADGEPLTDETAVPLPGESGEWSTELPDDPDRVRAFRIVYPPDYQVPPGGALEFEFPMFIKADAPLSDCTDVASASCSNIAWNTFGYSYREADSGVANQSAPTRVGVLVQETPPGSAGLGDYVWFDTNEDGVQSPDEVNNGINNVLVELWRDPDGVPDNGDELLLGEQRTTNHADTGKPGYYHFGLLPPTGGNERYFVRFYPPEGLTGSPRDAGADDVDSDGAETSVDGVTVFQTEGVQLQEGEDNLDIDQGLYTETPTFSLGNRVWLDPNNDSTDNDGAGGELGSGTGIAGVGVELWPVDGTGTPTGSAPLATETTNDTGHYLFTGLAAGDYRVVIPATQFAAGGPLDGLYSSATSLDGTGALVEGPPADGNSDEDAKDHGAVTASALGAVSAGSVVSGPVTLGPDAGEPIDELGELGPRQTPGYYDSTPDNRSNLTIDFGFYALSVGNQLWFDANDNGLRDAGELPVAGVTVELLDGADNVVGSSVSDSNGNWRVDGLAAGTYRARIPAAAFQPGAVLEGYNSSTGESSDFALSGDNNDHGLDGGDPKADGVLSSPFALGPPLPVGEELGAGDLGGNGPNGDAADNLTVDFGFHAYSVGNRVWLDANNDGVRAAGEPPVSGVVVEVVNDAGTVVGTATSDADGYWRVDGLSGGTYTARIPASEFASGKPLHGYSSSTGASSDFTLGGDDRDHGIDGGDPVADGVASAPFTLGPGMPVGEETSGSGQGDNGPLGDAADNLTVDFGFHAYSVGNRLWLDEDNDGVRDAGEPPVSGAVVEVLDDAGTLVGATITDANGYWRVDGLSGGTYTARIPASEFQPGAPLDGYQSSTGASSDFAIGGDDLDHGIDGGDPIADGVESGPFTLGPGVPVGEETSGSGQGDNGPLGDAADNLTVDFGFYEVGGPLLGIPSSKAVTGALEPPGTWLPDSAAPDNVARTAPEGGVSWQLRVENTAAAALDSLEIIDILPAAAADNPAGTGGNSAVDSGSDLGSAWTPRFVGGLEANDLPAGTVIYYTQAPNPCRDAIVAAPGCNPMADLADGVPLTDETAMPAPGAPGEWSPVLPSEPDRVRAFRILYPPDYRLAPGATLELTFNMFVDADAPLSDCTGSADDTCSNIAWNTFGATFRNTASDTVGETSPGKVGVIVQEPPDGSAGLGDYVWFDTNEDGVQNPDEVNNGIDDVLVELWRDPDGVPDSGDEELVAQTRTATTPVTSLPGYYHFGSLTPTVGDERYFVRFHPPKGLTGSPNDTGADDVDSDGVETIVGGVPVFQTPGVPLAEGEDRLDIDQGFYAAEPSFSLGNRVWLDANNDSMDNDGPGAAPGSSTGVDAVAVQLWAVDGSGAPVGAAPLAETTTNATGHYLFSGLAAGDYRVVIPVSQFDPGAALDGLWSSATSLDAAGALAEAPPVDGNSDEDAKDHGAVIAAAIGPIPVGSVVSGPVTLGPEADEPIDEIGEPGPRKTPGHYDPTPDNRSNLTIDFGFYALSVGNQLWFDDDNSGTRDAGEPPVAGVTVEVLDGAGNVVGSSVSDASGNWRVDGLAAGIYRALIPSDAFQPGEPLAGYAGSAGTTADVTLAGDNRDHGLDSPNPEVSGIGSPPFTLGPTLPEGEETLGTGQGGNGPNGDAADNLTVDFGFNLLRPLPRVLPPGGTKSIDASRAPELLWRLVWINGDATASLMLGVEDEIPAGTTYVPGSLSCQVRGISVQFRCEFDVTGNRILFLGLVGPDAGAAGEDDAANEVVIVFRTLIDASATSVSNQAIGRWDEDGDGDVEDENPVPSDNPGSDDPGDPTTWQRPSNPPVGIPTLSEWGLLLLVLLMAWAAGVARPGLRRH